MAGATTAPAAAQTSVAARAAAEQRQSRYQISQMERMLEGAVEHGLTVVHEKLRAAVRAQNFIPEEPENAHVRGFRLEGYGVFFDIEVPPLQGSLIWSLKTLDQNDLGLASAVNALRQHVATTGDASLQQALKRIELQVGPVGLESNLVALPPIPGTGRNATGAPATVSERVEALPDPPEPIMNDPEEGYRSEVKNQIMDAMLEYSVPLALRPDEWFTVGMRRHDDRPLIGPADSDARTVVIRIRGGDLAMFRAGQMTKDEALKKMVVQMF